MDELHYISRWLHYAFGVLWIGHLYFFNFVNMNFQPTMDAETKKKVNPELMPRALFVFRWGAMITFLTGLIMLAIIWGFPHDLSRWALFNADGTPNDKSWWMLVGALFGSIMWFNVWFIIWPNQKKIIRGVKGEGPAAPPEVVKLATNASKLNTYLSVPMLLGMMNGAHGYPIFGGGWVGLIVGILLGEAIVFSAYRLAPKISTKVS